MGIRVRLVAVFLAAAPLLLAAAAHAQDDRGRGRSGDGVVDVSDVDILYQPDPQNYQPDGNLDADDAGKSFAIVCTITGSGHLGNCYAEDNDINDQHFIRLALDNARRWVVGPTLRDGGPSAGMSFRLVCRFDLMGDGQAAPSIASNGR